MTKSNVSAQDIFGAAREKEMREVKKRAEECRGGGTQNDVNSGSQQRINSNT